MTRPAYEIREGVESDLPELIVLFKEHAEFEREDTSIIAPARDVSRLLFSSPPLVMSLVIQGSQKLLGYATYMVQASTWEAGNYLYLDCLYLRPEARGVGIGKEIMQRIAVEARALGHFSVQWQTPSSDTRAISFYERIGAKGKDKVRLFGAWFEDSP